MKNGNPFLTVLVLHLLFMGGEYYPGSLKQNLNPLKSPYFLFLNVSYVSFSRPKYTVFDLKCPMAVYFHMEVVIWLKFLIWSLKIRMYHFWISINCYKCIISLVKDYTMLQYSFFVEISLAYRKIYLVSRKPYFTFTL